MVQIGEASRQSGVNIETIRYYERQGIVSPAGRTASGRRVFSPKDVAQLRFVRRCRDLGFPLADIRMLLAFTEREISPCEEVGLVCGRHVRDIRERIRQLRRLEVALEELARGCFEGRADCPMLDALMSDDWE